MVSILVLLAVVTAQSGAANTAHADLSQALARARVGTTKLRVDASSSRFIGRLVASTDSSLSLAQRKAGNGTRPAPVEIPFASVNAVWVEGNGHPKKGMLIGFASGFALGLGIGLASEGGAWVSPAAVGIGLGTFLGLIGIPVGAMVGAGSPSWEPIYPAPH